MYMERAACVAGRCVGQASAFGKLQLHSRPLVPILLRNKLPHPSRPPLLPGGVADHHDVNLQ